MTIARRVLWALIASFALGTSALAAPPAAAPMVNWTGGYLGALAGYGWSSTTSGAASFWNDSAGTDFEASIPGFSMNGEGLLGGAEAGVGWDAGGIYWGFEADVAAADIKGSYTDGTYGYTADSALQWLSTARVRVGLPMDHFLIFGSGGLAVGGLQATLHDVYDSGATILTTTDRQTGVGWTVGGGVAADLKNGWSIKAEYLYVDLGSQNYRFPEGDPGWPLITNSAKTTASILRFGIDYRY